MLKLKRNFVVAVATLAVSGAMVLRAQRTEAGGPYTAAQATAGRATYQANCALLPRGRSLRDSIVPRRWLAGSS